jgi:hypothetical protein
MLSGAVISRVWLYRLGNVVMFSRRKMKQSWHSLRMSTTGKMTASVQIELEKTNFFIITKKVIYSMDLGKTKKYFCLIILSSLV